MQNAHPEEYWLNVEKLTKAIESLYAWKIVEKDGLPSPFDKCEILVNYLGSPGPVLTKGIQCMGEWRTIDSSEKIDGRVIG